MVRLPPPSPHLVLLMAILWRLHQTMATLDLFHSTSTSMEPRRAAFLSTTMESSLLAMDFLTLLPLVCLELTSPRLLLIGLMCTPTAEDKSGMELELTLLLLQLLELVFRSLPLELSSSLGTKSVTTLLATSSIPSKLF